MSHYTTHRKRDLGIVAAIMLLALALAATAHANTRNSMQPAHLYFGEVVTGNHPNRLLTLHNGTGAAYTIDTVKISGAGGYVFTLAANTPLLQQSGLTRCAPGVTLAPGARCAFDVRVHTTRAGWWRSVLSVVPSNGAFNSAELSAHVVGTVPARSTPPACSKWTPVCA